MNTLKFQMANLLATEQHNLEIEQTEKISLFGKTYYISVPCNLNIVITEACPSKCFFCIAHQSFKDYKPINSDNFIEGLKEILKVLPPQLFEITITGGEPTLYPTRLIETMQLCHKYGFKCRTFSTTGYGFDEDNNILKKMIDYKFVHNINISRMSISQEANNSIFGIAPNTNEKIERWAKFFKLNEAEMRLSCNLIRGMVDSMDKIFEYVCFYKKLGVDSVLFREMIGNGFDEKIVHLNNILDFSNMEYIETVHSNYYEVGVYKWNEYIVKHYKTRNINTSNISYMSYNHGILKEGFVGEKIYQYGK